MTSASLERGRSEAVDKHDHRGRHRRETEPIRLSGECGEATWKHVGKAQAVGFERR